MVEDKAVSRYVAEFVGTFILVATITGNVLSGEHVWGSVSWGCSLAVMIYALGKSSGAHFNPAVTVALTVAGKFPLSEVPYYFLSQYSGGLLAALLIMETHGGRPVFIAPLGDFQWWQACLVEYLYTLVLAFVILNVATSKQHAGKNQFYGMAIGFVIIAGAFGAGNVSGGCFNPAVTFGLDIGSSMVTFLPPNWYSFVYMIVQYLGGITASGVYFLVRPQDYVEGQDGSEPASTLSKLLSEFLGTFVLVLTVGLTVLTKSPAAAFSIACSLTSMIFALGTVSGAHFNPAVTLAVRLSGRNLISRKDAARYIFVQLIAGILGARTAWLSTGREFFSLKPEGTVWTQAFVAEFLWTAVLSFVVLSVATVKSPLSQYFGFAIGMCVTVGGLAIGNLSGGSLNPAVSLGIASASVYTHAWHFIPYIFVELVGGAIAAGFFFATQPSEYEELFAPTPKASSEDIHEENVIGNPGEAAVDVKDIVLRDGVSTVASTKSYDLEEQTVGPSPQPQRPSRSRGKGPLQFFRCFGVV